MRILVSKSAAYIGSSELAALDKDALVPTVYVKLRKAFIKQQIKNMPDKIKFHERQSDMSMAKELREELADLTHRVTLLDRIATKKDRRNYDLYLEYVGQVATETESK